MVRSGDALQALAYAGVGSGTGAIIAAVIAARSGKGPARAEAADLLVEAAERVSRMNQDLDKDNRKLRHEITVIVQAVDDFIAKKITEDELFTIVENTRYGNSM